MSTSEQFSIGDQVMVISGPHWFKTGEVEAIPAGFTHPLLKLRFYGRNGKLTVGGGDLVSPARVANFGRPRPV